MIFGKLETRYYILILIAHIVGTVRIYLMSHNKTILWTTLDM